MALFPIYCPECNKEDVVVRTPGKKAPYPKCCGRTMKTDFSRCRVQIAKDQPEYVTESITGEPVRVSGRRHENELCERNGVRRVSNSESGKRGERKNTAKDKKIKLPPLRDALEKKRSEMGYDSWR